MGWPQNVLIVARLHCHKACASPRNSTWVHQTVSPCERVGSGTRLVESCGLNLLLLNRQGFTQKAACKPSGAKVLVNALYGLSQLLIISLDCTMNIIIAIQTYSGAPDKPSVAHHSKKPGALLAWLSCLLHNWHISAKYVQPKILALCVLSVKIYDIHYRGFPKPRPLH